MADEMDAIPDIQQGGAESFLDQGPGLFHVAHQEQGHDDRQEGDRIDEIHILLPQVADDNAAQGGADNGSHAKGNGLHRERARQVFAWDKVRHQRLARRQVECHGGGLDGGQARRFARV